MFNVTRSNVGIVWYSGISGGSEQLPPLLIAWLPYYNLLRRRRCKWIPLCCANSQVMWMNSQDVQEDHMGGVSPITRLRSNQTNDHTSTPFHHSFSLLSHLPSYKLYLKSTLLFNLKKYIFYCKNFDKNGHFLVTKYICFWTFSQNRLRSQSNLHAANGRSKRDHKK